MTHKWEISADELNNWEIHIDKTIGYGINREVEVKEVINTVKAVVAKATSKAREEVTEKSIDLIWKNGNLPTLTALKIIDELRKQSLKKDK